MPDWVEVGCYAGGQGDETPRVVLLGGREVTLWVEGRWIEEPVESTGGERRRMFQVQLEDGHRCRLAQEPDGSWSLRTRQMVVNDPGRSVPGAVRRIAGHHLWFRSLSPAETRGGRRGIGLTMHRT